MNITEIIRQWLAIDWSRATEKDLKNYFLYYTGKDLGIQDLTNGAIYCKMIAATFPTLLDKRRIQLKPSCQAERALNWTLLKMAFTKLKEPIGRNIIPIERSRNYGNHDGLEFCKAFVAFYEKNYGQKIGNVTFIQGREMVSGYWVSRMIDDYGISLTTKSILHWNEWYFLFTDDEYQALGKMGKTPGSKILEIFGVGEGSAVTEEMIAQWKAGRDEKAKETGSGGHEERDKGSMWEYNQRCLPIEFVYLSPETFLMNSKENNICFLPTDILIMICKKLTVLDFVNLSLTCHYLHWRMFTFCKCYAPHTLSLAIKEKKIEGHLEYDHQLMNFYTQYNGLFGFFVSQPAKLPNPFFYKSVEVELQLPFYNNRHFEKCLPLINGIRRRAEKCCIMVYSPYHSSNDTINYDEINEFFKKINATSFRVSDTGDYGYPDPMRELYNRCPYTHQMEDVLVRFTEEQVHPAPEAFHNNTGAFFSPPYASVINTVGLIITGKIIPTYHLYSYRNEWILNDDVPNEILQYLFCQYVFDEIFSSVYGHIWETMVVVEETGRRFKLRILRKIDEFDEGYVCIAIGDENCFDEWDRRYQYLYEDGYAWKQETRWEMETAAEDDEWLADPEDEKTWHEMAENSDEAEETDEETTAGESTVENVADESEESQQLVARAGVPPVMSRPFQRRPAATLPPSRAAAAARLHAGLPVIPPKSRSQQ